MRQRRMERPAAAAVALLALWACSGPEAVDISAAAANKKLTHDDYDSYLARWTRSERVILLTELATSLRVHATMMAPEFAVAYAARRAHVFKLPPGEERALRERLLAQWGQHYVFHVAAAARDYKWNDFEREQSVWRVALVAGEREVEPAKVQAERAVTPTTRDLFPFVGAFHRAYWFRFPRELPDGTSLVGPDTRQLVLRFAGALGQADLTWQLR